MNALKIPVFCMCLCGVLTKHETYDGHTVYDVNIKNESDAKVFTELEDKLNLDVWSHEVPGQSHHAKVLVPKVNKEEFENALKNARVEYKIRVENIKEYLDLEDRLLAGAITRARIYKPRLPSLPFNTIHSYSRKLNDDQNYELISKHMQNHNHEPDAFREKVSNYLDYLAKTYRMVNVVNRASFQGRQLKFVKISDSYFRNTSKPIIYMQSLLHAREWLSLPVTLYTINKLIIDQHRNHVDLIRNFDWIILPIANPDGYEWTHTKERLWRKNRAHYPNDSCTGVDLNRNFGHSWGRAYPVRNICQEQYQGRRPFSEPETRVIRDILVQYRKRIVLFLDIHSTGSMILYPYGTGHPLPNLGLYNSVGEEMAKAINKVKWASNIDYTVGNVAFMLYRCSGLAMDYASSIGVPLSYTIEMPSYSTDEFVPASKFLVDPNFIEQAGFEIWEAIKVAARAAEYLKNKKP